MIGIVIGVAGLYIAYLAYKKSFPANTLEPVEEKADEPKAIQHQPVCSNRRHTLLNCSDTPKSQ